MWCNLAGLRRRLEILDLASTYLLLWKEFFILARGRHCFKGRSLRWQRHRSADGKVATFCRLVLRLDPIVPFPPDHVKPLNCCCCWWSMCNRLLRFTIHNFTFATASAAFAHNCGQDGCNIVIVELRRNRGACL